MHRYRENRIDSLITTVNDLKQENATLKEQIKQRKQEVEELSSQKGDVDKLIETLKGESEQRQKKLDLATEKIQALVTKLESVQ